MINNHFHPPNLAVVAFSVDSQHSSLQSPAPVFSFDSFLHEHISLARTLAGHHQTLSFILQHHNFIRNLKPVSSARTLAGHHQTPSHSFIVLQTPSHSFIDLQPHGFHGKAKPVLLALHKGTPIFLHFPSSSRLTFSSSSLSVTLTLFHFVVRLPLPMVASTFFCSVAFTLRFCFLSCSPIPTSLEPSLIHPSHWFVAQP